MKGLIMKIVEFSVNRPKLVIGLTLVVTLIFAIQFPKIRIDTDPENMLREDEVNIFLIAKGAEYEGLSDEQYNIIEQAEKFTEKGGRIYACGTCLRQRNSAGSKLCPVSSMKDLYRIVAESDKVLTF